MATTSETATSGTATSWPGASSRSAWIGLVAGLMLIAASIVVPMLLDWDVRARQSADAGVFPPLHGYWLPNVGPGTLPSILLALLAWRYAAGLAERLRWRSLLAASYAAALAWMVALAYVDGSEGISRALGNEYEYLQAARGVGDVPAMLDEFVSRISYDSPDNWPVHVAGHPPGALLIFVALARVGLGSDHAAGMAVTVLAATTALAVLVTLRALSAEAVARTAAPFLVFTPAAVFAAVSADAVFTAIASWGLAALALGATGERRGPSLGWSVLAGLLLGAAVMMSYGLPLIGLTALAVLAVVRRWGAFPVVAASALVVVLAFVPFGFAWWEAYPVLSERYWQGLAQERPASYWIWGNLGALLISGGPALGAGLAGLTRGRALLREPASRAVTLLAGSALLIVLLANASQMSKAEVERIWLPFIPWLTLAMVLVPQRWWHPMLAVQLGTALIVQHLLYTSW